VPDPTLRRGLALTSKIEGSGNTQHIAMSQSVTQPHVLMLTHVGGYAANWYYIRMSVFASFGSWSSVR